MDLVVRKENKESEWADKKSMASEASEDRNVTFLSFLLASSVCMNFELFITNKIRTYASVNSSMNRSIRQ